MIKQILEHLERKAESKNSNPLPESRGTATKGFVRVDDKIKVKLNQTTNLLSAKEAAGSRHAWWLQFGGITRWEGAIL